MVWFILYIRFYRKCIIYICFHQSLSLVWSFNYLIHPFWSFIIIVPGFRKRKSSHVSDRVWQIKYYTWQWSSINPNLTDFWNYMLSPANCKFKILPIDGVSCHFRKCTGLTAITSLQGIKLYSFCWLFHTFIYNC